jgi:hypothetical protein
MLLLLLHQLLLLLHLLPLLLLLLLCHHRSAVVALAPAAPAVAAAAAAAAAAGRRKGPQSISPQRETLGRVHRILRAEALGHQSWVGLHGSTRRRLRWLRAGPRECAQAILGAPLGQMCDCGARFRTLARSP